MGLRVWYGEPPGFWHEVSPLGRLFWVLVPEGSGECERPLVAPPVFGNEDMDVVGGCAGSRGAPGDLPVAEFYGPVLVDF